MNLFFILYTATGIGGTWGPLPYDMAECLDRKRGAETELAEKIQQGLPPEAEPARHWRFECEFHKTRPQLEPEDRP